MSDTKKKKKLKKKSFEEENVEVLLEEGEVEDLKEEPENKVLKFFKENYIYMIFLVLILLFKFFIYSPLYVHGESMMTTLHEGDIMVLDIVGYRHSGVSRFDIVVVNPGNELLIKRVIGLPGEIIQYKNNELYVNGKKVEDKFGNGITEDFEVKVPEDSYYVLGDNRENSMDSRYFGPFKKEDILGKTKLVIFPFDRFGNKE